MSESTVFVVRVWRDSELFRATARAVDDDQMRVFTQPQDLLRFLQAGRAARTVDREHEPSSSAPPS